jgi:hypothetical protein
MKILFFYTIVAAVVVVAGWNVSQSKNEIALTDVVLENVEALADESSTHNCPGGSAVCTVVYVQDVMFTFYKN